MRKQQSELRKALGSCRGAFLMTAVFSFFVNLLLLTSPLYMLQVYDRVLASRSEMTLLMLTIITVAALLVMALLELVRSQILVRISTRLDRMMSGRIFDAIFEMALRKPSINRSQPIVDFMNLRQFLTGNGILALCDAPWTPIFLLVMYAFNPLLGYMGLAGAIILVALTIASELTTRLPLGEAQVRNASSMRLAESSLRNLEVLQAMGMVGGLRQRWLATHDDVLGLQTLASDRGGFISAITRFVRIALQSLLLGAGGYLAINGKISPGMVIAGSILGGRALAPVELLIGSWKGFLTARSGFARLESLLTEVPPPAERMALPPPRGALSLEEVSVAAPGEAKPILRGINLSFMPGDIVGVVGPSAAGKSSLARVIVGVWRPIIGKVRLDGADIWTLDRQAVGPYIGYLPQTIELFDATVAENIARFGEVDSAQVIAAAQRAGIHEMILELPQGYDTQIGEAGYAISGGQRQRIALARALYKNPPLVVLDEPNSNLDHAGEAALVAAMAEMRKAGQTAIVITHRPELLTAVDKVVVMRAGEIALSGPAGEILPRILRPVPTSIPGAGAANSSGSGAAKGPVRAGSLG